MPDWISCSAERNSISVLPSFGWECPHSVITAKDGAVKKPQIFVYPPPTNRQSFAVDDTKRSSSKWTDSGDVRNQPIQPRSVATEAMHRPTRLKITDLNPHLTCILCGGYLIDATTIIECLHSFCRTCIVRYLETTKFCPICDVQVHKAKPLLNIRADKTLQDMVYKLVPGLFQNEMKLRREFYSEHPEADLNGRVSPEDRGEVAEQRFIYTPDETISLSLEYGYGINQVPKTDVTSEDGEGEKAEIDTQRRYLRCPAAVMVSQLKKLIEMKYNLPARPNYRVEIMYYEDYLRDDYSLMDIAYIYAWKRNGPMRLFYRIVEKPPKRQKTFHSLPLEEPADNSKDELLDELVMDVDDPIEETEKLKEEEKINETEITAAVTSAVTVAATVPTTSVVASETKKENVDNDGKPEETPMEIVDNEQEGKSSSAEDTLLTEKSDTPSSKKEEAQTVEIIPDESPIQPEQVEKEASSNEVLEGVPAVAEETNNEKDELKDQPSSPKKEEKEHAGDDEAEGTDDTEADSGRGSDVSSQARSSCDDDIGSPISSANTPEVDKSAIVSSSPTPIASPVPEEQPLPPPPRRTSESRRTSSTLASPRKAQEVQKDENGALDLSTSHRHGRGERPQHHRPRHVANPPVLDKHRLPTCLPAPRHPCFKLLPTPITHGVYKKHEFGRTHRCKSNLTVINPDPNSFRPKIVIKALDPRPEQAHSHHHHHHHRRM